MFKGVTLTDIKTYFKATVIEPSQYRWKHMGKKKSIQQNKESKQIWSEFLTRFPKKFKDEWYVSSKNGDTKTKKDDRKKWW